MIHTRKDEIDQKAAAFSKEHPNVSKMFIKFTLEAIARGFANYSTKAVFERIRWEADQADSDGRSTFKMNNNYTSWYARRFMELYPQHQGFFRTREQTSANQGATGMPELTPSDYPTTNAQAQ